MESSTVRAGSIIAMERSGHYKEVKMELKKAWNFEIAKKTITFFHSGKEGGS